MTIRYFNALSRERKSWKWRIEPQVEISSCCMMRGEIAGEQPWKHFQRSLIILREEVTPLLLLRISLVRKKRNTCPLYPRVADITCWKPIMFSWKPPTG